MGKKINTKPFPGEVTYDFTANSDKQLKSKASFEAGTMPANTFYPKYIRDALEDVLDIESSESIIDVRRLYSNEEIFDAVLEHEGIMHYGDWLVQLIRDIYGIDLTEVE